MGIQMLFQFPILLTNFQGYASQAHACFVHRCCKTLHSTFVGGMSTLAAQAKEPSFHFVFDELEALAAYPCF
jgi:hypothetical protein